MSTPPTTKAKPRTNPASDPQPPRFSSDVALATTDVANATIDVAYATNCSHGYIPIATFRCRTLFAAQGHSALPRFYLAKSPRPPAQSRFPPDAAIPNRADRKPRIPDPIVPSDAQIPSIKSGTSRTSKAIPRHNLLTSPSLSCSCSCSISMKELVGLKTVLRDDGTRAIGRITWMQPGSNINQGPSRRTTRCFTSESINTQSSLQFL